MPVQGTRKYHVNGLENVKRCFFSGRWTLDADVYVYVYVYDENDVYVCDKKK